jgi:RNA polymerase sigma factor (sigma-70 family)
MHIDINEVDNIARKYLELKNAAKNGTRKEQIEYRRFQTYCVNKMMPIILNKTSKYMKFSNYSDLKQDGCEALIMAFESYDPNSGSFFWWADKYVKTKVSRAANKHSTISVPLRKAGAQPPIRFSIPNSYDPDTYIGMVSNFSSNGHYSTDCISLSKLDLVFELNRAMDLISDRKSSDPYELLNDFQNAEIIKDAINELTPRQREIIMYYFEFYSGDDTVIFIAKKLGTSSTTVKKHLKKAITILRAKLKDYFNEVID